MLNELELKTLQAMARGVVANRDSEGVALFSGLTPEDKRQFWDQLSESMRKKLVSTLSLSVEALKPADADVDELRRSAFAAMTSTMLEQQAELKARWQAMNAEEKSAYMDKLGVTYRDY